MSQLCGNVRLSRSVPMHNLQKYMALADRLAAKRPTERDRRGKGRSKRAKLRQGQGQHNSNGDDGDK